MANYKIGIDLGTTNSVVSYIDLRNSQSKIELFKIPQLIECNEIAKRTVLPSCIYIPSSGEIKGKEFALDWDNNNTIAVGEYARKMLSKKPLKVVSSAKSWLCSDSIDRSTNILPWGSDEKDIQISPIEATKLILEIVKNAWNYEIAEKSKKKENLFEEQDIVITVPASFDAVARDYTEKAANMLGINAILLEEPQAAFYSWINSHGKNWRKEIGVGDVVFVCDIGGGTTDFSLINVTENNGNLELDRIAVGNHILLGGDNMDLALAFYVSTKLKREKNIALDTYQLNALTFSCRDAKETMFLDPNKESMPLTILGRGSSVIGGAIKTSLNKEELENVIISGFLPECELSILKNDSEKIGIKTFGLKYESEPAITKHIADFLLKSCPEGKMPNCILFNGGVTKSEEIRKKIVSLVCKWDHSSASLKVLDGTDPDLAVAIGASAYSLTKDGRGIRIKAGSSSSYYIGIETSMPAVPGYRPPVNGLCVLPMGVDEGTSFEINYNGLGIIVGENVEFKFYMSRVKNSDKVSSLINDINTNDNYTELAPLSINLKASEKIPIGSLVPIKISVSYTETGTLQIWCTSNISDEKWKLDFELR